MTAAALVRATHPATGEEATVTRKVYEVVLAASGWIVAGEAAAVTIPRPPRPEEIAAHTAPRVRVTEGKDAPKGTRRPPRTGLERA